MPGVGGLANLAVNKRPHPQAMGVSDFIGGDDTRAKGTVRIERFSEHPLRGFLLPIANGDVVADRVAEDVIRGALRRNATALLADNDHEFNFVIQLIRYDGLVYSAKGRVYRSRLLAEPDLLSRNLYSC